MSRRAELTEPIEWSEEYLIDVLGIDPVKAEFMIAIQRGSITGDIVEPQRPQSVVRKSIKKQ